MLADLAGQLEQLWTATGDMAGTVHDPDAVRWDRQRWRDPADGMTGSR